MSEQPGKVEARIESARQLSSVVSAMRSIAAGRARDARRQLDGIRAYAQTIGTAISEALAMTPPPAVPSPANGSPPLHVVIVFCTEQGFVGAFNDRLFDALARLPGQSDGGSTDILLVGDRGLGVAEQRQVRIDWSSPMIVHPDQAGELASRVAQVVLERIPQSGGMDVQLLHAMPGTAADTRIVERRIIPFDYARFQAKRSDLKPLTTLPPQALLTKLAEEYMFAELCEAVMLSFVAENEDRVRAMTAAGTNVSRSLEELVGLSRQLRQEAITTEIIELATGTSSL